MIKDECWQTKANDKTPNPTKMVSHLIIESVMSKDCHDSRIGAIYRTRTTILKRCKRGERVRPRRSIDDQNTVFPNVQEIKDDIYSRCHCKISHVLIECGEK
jgi:hypothetical protein